MGGLPCAKQVLDNGRAVVRALDCMGNSILLNAHETQPTEEQLDAFVAAGDALAGVAAKIQAYVSGT